jgi:predicted HTH domain antitoxin
MASVTVTIPDDVLARLRAGGSEPDKTIRLAAAFSLCRQGQLATSQAARLAGLTYGDFLQAAADAKIDLFPVDLEELKEQISGGYTLGRQHVPDNLVEPGAMS